MSWLNTPKSQQRFNYILDKIIFSKAFIKITISIIVARLSECIHYAGPRQPQVLLPCETDLSMVPHY